MGRIARISKGGQISIPADVRRRWATDSVIIEDEGGHLVVYPMPEDPVAAAMGAFPSSVPAEDALRQLREEEDEAERRKWGS